MKEQLRVLIVDDEPVNVYVLAQSLSEEYAITIATTGTSAIYLANQTLPDIILLDIELPDISGLEVCEMLKNNHTTCKIPVVFITSHCAAAEEVKGLALGAVDYIHKPFSLPIINARIANHLSAKQKQDQLESMARLDSLTGLPNRRYFEEEYEKSWRFAQRKQRSLTFALLDIDYFKQYNDFYGHSQGDECLYKVAQQLKSSLSRPLDFVSRYGGEEFAVILPDSNINNAHAVAENIREGIESLAIPHQHPDIQSNLTVSIGVASLIPLEKNPQRTLIEEADRQLYYAKTMGRNRAAIA